jgi:hypothetical protein
VNTNNAARQGPSFLPSIISLGVVLLAMLGAFLFGQARGSRGLGTILQDNITKSRLVAGMQENLLVSAEAEKSAVMAETDAASEAFAAESRRASATVESDRKELARLIDGGAQPEEVRHLREFSTCWTRYQEIDDEILRLAVENTNLKAQRLSFVPAPAALDRMQAALDTVVADTGTSVEAAAIAKRAYQVMPAALRIHALEGRHIAESNDAEMDKIDAEMKLLDGKVNEGLSALSALSDDAGKAAIEAARAAYADFQRVHTEVLALSRRNSNVCSFAMSLGQKRKVMAECQDRLNALQEAVQTVFEATR